MKWPLAVLLIIGAASAAFGQSDAPFNRYLAAAEAGKQDPRLTAFAHTCYDTEIKPNRMFFYTEQNDWLPAKDLAFAFAGYETGDANTAEVWMYAGKPREVYLWEVDLEYQRDTLFCLNTGGEVVRTISRFFPSESGEPREHWVYVHTVKPGPRINMWESYGVYEDARGVKLGKPEVSTEDRDFIAGERAYRYFHDFDFASQIAAPITKAGAEKSNATP